MNNNNNSVIKLHPVLGNKVNFINRHFLICGFDENFNVVKLPVNELDNYENLFQAFLQFPKDKYSFDIYGNCVVNYDALKSHFCALVGVPAWTFATLKFAVVELELKLSLYVDDEFSNDYLQVLDAVTHTYEFNTSEFGLLKLSFDVTPDGGEIIQVVSYKPADNMDVTKGRFIDTNLFEMVNVTDTHKAETRNIADDSIKYVLAYSVLSEY